MMTLPVHKKQLFKLVLAFYFLIFSISPLTYAVSDKQTPEIIDRTVQKSPGMTSVPLVLASFAERQSYEETAHAAGKTHVLIKKKRAIVPKDPLEKIAAVTTASGPKNDFNNPLAPAAFRSNVTPENIRQIHNGFNPLYAGNAPPSV